MIQTEKKKKKKKPHNFLFRVMAVELGRLCSDLCFATW